jgi:tetratricopeptide (TPR) repeat protein
LRALAGLFSLCGATGELSRAPALAQHFQRIASLSKDPFDALVAERMMGTALFGLNDLAAAQAHLTKAATFGAAHRCAAHILRYQFDISVSNRVTLAHVLWLRGLADQAISVMHTNLEAARRTGHPTSLFSAIGASGCPISLATGNLPMAQRMIDELIELASRHLVDQYRNAAYCFLGALLVKQGDPAAGLQLLNSSKPTMLDYTFLPIYYLPVSAMIAEALGLCGRVEEGLAEIEECLQPSNIRGRTWNVPELHRLRGELLLRDSAMVDLEGAEKAFKRAIQQANHQGLLSFELRASTSLARLHLREGRKDEAGTLLGSVCSRFSEGYQTADFQEAQRLLSLLASSGST